MTTENTPFEVAETAITGMITDGQMNLKGLAEYLEVAQYWARLATLPAVFEAVLNAGYTPHELVYGLAQFSYRWDCTDQITGRLEAIANDERLLQEGKGEPTLP